MKKVILLGALSALLCSAPGYTSGSGTGDMDQVLGGKAPAAPAAPAWAERAAEELAAEAAAVAAREAAAKKPALRADAPPWDPAAEQERDLIEREEREARREGMAAAAEAKAAQRATQRAAAVKEREAAAAEADEEAARAAAEISKQAQARLMEAEEEVQKILPLEESINDSVVRKLQMAETSQQSVSQQAKESAAIRLPLDVKEQDEKDLLEQDLLKQQDLLKRVREKRDQFYHKMEEAKAAADQAKAEVVRIAKAPAAAREEAKRLEQAGARVKQADANYQRILKLERQKVGEYRVVQMADTPQKAKELAAIGLPLDVKEQDMKALLEQVRKEQRKFYLQRKEAIAAADQAVADAAVERAPAPKPAKKSAKKSAKAPDPA